MSSGSTGSAAPSTTTRQAVWRSNVSVVAAAITQRATDARVCIMGALLPLNNPVRVAEEYALVDAMSGGRLVAGLLRGAPYEYLVYNVPPAESRARFEEAWELVMRAWSDTEPFGWEGEHYHFRYVSIWPRPIQQPMPPIFISGSSRESAEFAARRRIGLGLAFTNLAAAKPAAQYYFAQSRRAGLAARPRSGDLRARAGLPGRYGRASLRAGSPARRIAITWYPGCCRPIAWSPRRASSDRAIRSCCSGFRPWARSAPLSLEKQLELGMLLCGSPETVLDQLRTCASGARRWRGEPEFRNGRQQRRNRGNHAPVRS